ncbi:nucleotidyltransferase family protein [Telmatobacter bradus]|uniref:nucleotidyltransferase family protein n=1 Tax=Telmatobacter bradus TaxID=474953 RepID=UPI003B43016A
MEAVVLAGGFGTRLASRLKDTPKPMAPVAGRPFLEYLLTNLSRRGFTHVVLSVGHLHEVIEQHFGASFAGMRLDYVVEEAPLGTGGAIRAALAWVKQPSVLVLNGDTYLDADYAAMMQAHAEAEAALTMAICQQPDIARYGGVMLEKDEFVQRVMGFEEKGRSGPGWINAGAYAIARALAWPPALEEKFSFERDFLMPEVARLKPLAFTVEGFFLDIGIPEDLDRAQTALTNFAR